ncbi:class I SAM-dependent methyltransferase [Paenalkalicoccus suaedae]|uniref:Uncharacterized methyltransferase FLK61_25180 n=1 Tax=Paenalkalicoccus suaedae TaxID=2592382 RepID=A0A859FA50_9BACI|nr:class I SAM-dependent methyltransferase [Paenalkalicoccus suaedae]QKS70069.1 class I SAM-dependent methyltransferase [Paenalkalicoccus suaedae]
MGREFIELFDRWADSYDATVTGHDEEYKEVFEGYDEILQEVASSVSGSVVEFGVGTGNLSEKLLTTAAQVTGVEPSEKMRAIASQKHPSMLVVEGDFLDHPIKENVDGIVSTYAFHHLTDIEKKQAAENFYRILNKGGKVVFADTMFSSETAKEEIIQNAISRGFLNLAEDLQTEYYPYIGTMQEIFSQVGFHVELKQLNRFVWLFTAKKEN